MSCPRCGGVLDAELKAAMVKLVCGMVIIEGRYCHCDDDEGSMHASLLPDDDGTRDGQSQRPTPSKGRMP